MYVRVWILCKPAMCIGKLTAAEVATYRERCGVAAGDTATMPSEVDLMAKWSGTVVGLMRVREVCCSIERSIERSIELSIEPFHRTFHRTCVDVAFIVHAWCMDAACMVCCMFLCRQCRRRENCGGNSFATGPICNVLDSVLTLPTPVGMFDRMFDRV